VESVIPHKVLTVVGILALPIGLIGVAWSILPGSGSDSVTLPAGQEYYGYLKIAGFEGGHLSGDFEVTPGDISLYVLDSDQFAEFRQSLSPSGCLFMIVGSSGSFSVDMPNSGTCYIAFNHGLDYRASQQTVRVNFNATGINIGLFVGGLIVLAVGAVLIFAGRRMKKKARAMEPAPVNPPAADVVFFQNRPKST
jgi:hypothetical protein